MLGMDVELSEEDQMMAAIAASLGHHVAEAMDVKPDGQKKAVEEEEKKDDEDDAEKDKMEPEEPLEKEILDHFAENVMAGELWLLEYLPALFCAPQENGFRFDNLCLLILMIFLDVADCMQLLDILPESVYRVCDLIGVITHRNGATWRNGALKTLVLDVSFSTCCVM